MDDVQLSPVATLAGHTLRSYRSLESTNQTAAQAAREEQADNLWIVAGEQTAGKGRRGRTWQSLSGNLATSIVINLNDKINAVHLLGFVAAIALARTVSTLLPGQAKNISLKWPNDVLLGKAKLAGILLEAIPSPKAQRTIIVGMGMNVASAPADLSYDASHLNQYDKSIFVADVFEELTKNWLEVFALWDYDKGRSAILAQWQLLSKGIGEPISVRRTNDVVRGTFKAIDDEGRLIILLANGQKEIITAGDVMS